MTSMHSNNNNNNNQPLQIQPSNFISKLLDPTIFEVIVALSLKYKAINLASGFPDWETPEFLLQNTSQAFNSGENQYAMPGGHPLLLQKVAERYSAIFQRELVPSKNVTIGLGGSGVIYDIYASYLNQDDEVVLFEPFFEYHSKEAKLLGANVRTSSLIEPQDFQNGSWRINFEEFESLFNEKTRILVLNSPHNPTGKVFTHEEYQRIAEIVSKYPKVLVMADDVYETLVFDDRKFARFIDIPGMYERTLSVFSLGKMFSCTGWRVGYCIGPEYLIKPVRATHAIICYSVHRPSQIGFAKGLDEAKKKYLGSEDDYLTHMKKRFEQNRNDLLQGFKDLGVTIQLSKPEGGYFIVGSLKDYAHKIPRKYFYKDFENVVNGDTLLGDSSFEELEGAEVTPDVAFTKFMTIEKGVSVIPMTSFYSQSDQSDLKKIKGRYYFRIALCRKDSTIVSAFQKLQQTMKDN